MNVWESIAQFCISLDEDSEDYERSLLSGIPKETADEYEKIIKQFREKVDAETPPAVKQLIAEFDDISRAKLEYQVGENDTLETDRSTHFSSEYYSDVRVGFSISEYRGTVH